MSATSLAKVAVERDIAEHGKTISKSGGEVLAAAIPSEALTAYTALLGVVIAANIGDGYAAFRWAAYAAFIALAFVAPIMNYVRDARQSGDKKRKFPIPIFECTIAAFAAAGLGLVMPGSALATVLSDTALVLATAAITLGTTAVIASLLPTLGTGNRH